MISVAAAILRFATVLTILVWLPGWIVSRRPLRPLRILHGFLLGAAVHIAALCITSLVTAQVDRAVWILPAVTFALAFAMRALLTRISPDPLPDPPTLGYRTGFVVAGLVLLAAMLRLLHNFHFDDLQHLFYLTELERQNVLFPQDLMLSLTTRTVPGLGEGSVMVSRYPFWAASCVLLGRLGQVVPGDAYLMLGLSALALVLGQMAALVGRAWSPGAGILWVLTIVAAGPFLSDSLLNYGGYPFQMGKLFVLLAATSVLVTWRTRRAEDLVPAACGLLIAPLLHTNNAVGTVGVLCLAAPMAFAARLRKPAAVLVVPLLVLGFAGLGSLASRGFVRWTPESVLSPRPSVTTAPAEVARIDQSPRIESKVIKDPVARRLVLFVSRGIPSEILLLLLALAAVPLIRRAPVFAGALTLLLIAAAGALVLADFAASAARQTITMALKPGYARLRAGLLAIAPAIDPARPVLTDPITDVLGRAAGWRMASAPPLLIDEQSIRLLTFHPAVRGAALDRVLAASGPVTLVVNEEVLGPGTTAKFDQLPSLTRVARWGDPLPRESAADSHASSTIEALYSLDFATLVSAGSESARDVVSVLWERPLTVFASAAAKNDLDPGELGRLVRADGRPGGTSRFLNSALVTLPRTGACVDGADVTLRNRASFDSPILVWPLDHVARGAARGMEFRTLGLTGARATMPVGFGEVVCDTGPLTLLVHSGYWWDFRFDVEAAEWKLSRSAE